VLNLSDPEREHDVADTADDRERRHPRNQEHGAPTVVAGRPDPEPELDDPADQLQPPDVDLVPGLNRLDLVERPGEDEEEAEDGRQRDERVARVNEGHDTGGDEDERQDRVQ
jgi:hypothetical protein